MMNRVCLKHYLSFHFFFQNDQKNTLSCKLYRYFCTACPQNFCVWGRPLESLTSLSCVVTRESSLITMSCASMHGMPDFSPLYWNLTFFQSSLRSRHSSVASIYMYVVQSSKQERSSLAAISSACLVFACQ